MLLRAATILRLLVNEMNQFNRGKKSKPGFRKQLNIDVKSTTKLDFSFKYINIFIHFINKRCFRFSFLYFKHLQTLIVGRDGSVDPVSRYQEHFTEIS